MKKILALVLAVAMLSTVAFAATAKKPGDSIKLKSTDTDMFVAFVEDSGTASAFNTKNYSIKKVSYTAGKALVDSVTLSADEEEGDELKIALKQDYTMDKAKDLQMTIELNGKGKTVKDVTLANDATTNYYTVGYTASALEINGDNEVTGTLNADTIAQVGKDQAAPYGSLELTAIAGTDTDISVRLYEEDEFFWNPETTADKKVLIANADSEAVISFLSFEGKPSFNSTATLYIYDVNEDGFVYELVGAGKVAPSAAKWSEDEGCWILKTRTLGSYVFSDIALVAAESEEVANPDTGANDVVSVAAALAVVSLVAAGAVSLKK